MSPPTSTSWNRVRSGYFATIGTRVMRGRGIDERDTPARRAWRWSTRRLRRGSSRGAIRSASGSASATSAARGDFEIVGVVEDVKYTDANQPVRPMIFLAAVPIAAYTSDGDLRGSHARSTMLRAVVVQVAPSRPTSRRAIRAADRRSRPGRHRPPRDADGRRRSARNFRIERLMARLSDRSTAAGARARVAGAVRRDGLRRRRSARARSACAWRSAPIGGG